MSRWIVAVIFLPLLLTFGISSVRGQAKDKSAEWAQGSTWSGTVEQKAGKEVVRVDVTLVVVKRKGKVFEGRYEVLNGRIGGRGHCG
jgi:hypothetical protein